MCRTGVFKVGSAKESLGMFREKQCKHKNKIIFYLQLNNKKKKYWKPLNKETLSNSQPVHFFHRLCNFRHYSHFCKAKQTDIQIAKSLTTLNLLLNIVLLKCWQVNLTAERCHGVKLLRSFPPTGCNVCWFDRVLVEKTVRADWTS